MLVFKRVLEILLGKLGELIEHVIESGVADGVEPHRRGSDRCEPNLIKSHFFSEVTKYLFHFGYLRRHYGKVYINAAAPDEITTSLGLSTKDADAIAAYRKANGSFADFEAVKKVPGIDVKTLEEHKEAVAF